MEEGQVKKSSKQFKALFIKNLKIQSRQPCTNLCQIITPIICLIFTVLIRQVAIANIPTNKDSVYNIAPFIPFKFNNYTYEDLLEDYVKRRCSQWFTYRIKNQADSQFLGRRDGIHKNSGMLNQIKNNYRKCAFNLSKTEPFKEEHMYPPIFRQQNQTINKQLMNDYNYFYNLDYEDLHHTSGIDKMPDGAITFNQVNSSALKADLKINDLRSLEYHRADGLTRIKFYVNKTDEYQSYYTISQGFLSLMQIVSNAYIKQLHKKDMESGAVYMPFTSDSSVGIDILISTVSAVLFPLSLSLLLPVFLYLIVLEKEEKLIQMMRMNGLKMRTYWLVNFIFNFVLSLLTNIVFVLFGYFFLHNNLFVNTGWDVLVVVLLGWVLAQIGLATFLQVFISTSQAANIIGYLFSIWTNLIGATLSAAIFVYPRALPKFLLLFPTFSFNRIFYLLFTECSQDHCYRQLSMISQEVKLCIISLYVGFAVLQLLGMYLYEVVPQQFGTTQPLLFPFSSIIKFFRRRTNHQIEHYEAQFQDHDSEAKQQRNRIKNINDSSDYALICNSLKKVYSNGKVAVKGMDLIVSDKEIFGLLGPNGAGKTTLISMITGVFDPTRGNAFVGGYSIKNQIDKVHLEMGVCPQFDLLWPQLTVEEHLYFYTRLRGTEGTEEEETVEKTLEEVRLTRFRNFKSTQLSGGMKRRLSIGISMVGNPRIIFLDEPTTGLDPENRRNIWQLLSKCKEHRSLFLTTHLMEQASTLCNRIGIITDGVLRTVGSQLKLRKQYGSGYYLSLNLEVQRQIIETVVKPKSMFNSVESQSMMMRQSLESEEVNLPKLNETMVRKASVEDVHHIKEKISRLFPYSILVKEINGYLRFKLGNIVISEVMEKLNESPEEIRKGWGLSSSNLEDVFMEIVGRYKEQNQSDAGTVTQLEQPINGATSIVTEQIEELMEEN